MRRSLVLLFFLLLALPLPQRPTDRRADEAFEVEETGGGSYRGTAHGVAAGQWDLVIEADRGGKRLFLSRNRVVLN